MVKILSEKCWCVRPQVGILLKNLSEFGIFSKIKWQQVEGLYLQEEERVIQNFIQNLSGDMKVMEMRIFICDVFF